MAAITNNSNNSIKTRIQLKSDTETNWNKSVLIADGGTKTSGNSFVPLLGELIVYLPDSTYNYSRLKIGDGVKNVVALPFIDAGTVNGDTIVNEIVTFQGNFPENGDSTKLYVNTYTKTIYYYNGTNYEKLSNYTYTVYKSQTKTVQSWSGGTQPSFSLLGGTLTLKHGQWPSLSLIDTNYVYDVKKEGET